MTGLEILERVREIADDSSINGYDEINESYRSILLANPGWELKIRDESSVAFVASTATYSLPSAVRSLGGIWVQSSENQQDWVELKEVSESIFEQSVYANRNTSGADIEGKPQVYRLSSAGFEVNPTPDDAYTVRIEYLGNITDLTRSTSPIIPTTYHHLVAYEAAARVMEMRGGQDNAYRANVLRARSRTMFESLANDKMHSRVGPIGKPCGIMRAQ